MDKEASTSLGEDLVVSRTRVSMMLACLTASGWVGSTARAFGRFDRDGVLDVFVVAAAQLGFDRRERGGVHAHRPGRVSRNSSRRAVAPEVERADDGPWNVAVDPGRELRARIDRRRRFDPHLDAAVARQRDPRRLLRRVDSVSRSSERRFVGVVRGAALRSASVLRDASNRSRRSRSRSTKRAAQSSYDG